MNSRALSEFEALSLGVDTRSNTAVLPNSSIRKRVHAATQGQSLISETAAPAYEVTKKYLFQSYFSDSLGATAILPQAPSEPIVTSTLSKEQSPGYAVGLHPSSDCPIAIKFYTGAQQGASAPYRLTPGQTIRPHGKPGETSGAFSGFEFGLPFGWLGGGSVLLVVMRTPDAQVCWNSAPELIYHRMRLQIVAPASIPLAAAVASNWPHRFPWPYAVSGTNSLTQRGQPALAVTPTRVAMRLRLADTSGGPYDMRMLMYGTNDFDLDSAGAIASATIAGYQDMTWGQSNTLVGSVGVGTTQYQYQTFGIDTPITRFSADEGGAVVLTSSSAAVQGQYVDIVRYGRL